MSEIGPRGKQDAVREQLAQIMARLSPGDVLPAERDLAKQFGVARMTVRRAIDLFAAEGKVVRRPGAGTFLAPPRLDQRLTATSFSADMRSRGLTPGARTLSHRVAPAGMMLGSVLNMAPHQPVLHVRRLRTADGQPMAVEDLHVPVHLTPGLTGEDLRDASFYDVLHERFGLDIARGTQTVEPCLVADDDAAVLEVDPGSPAFQFERTSTLADGCVIEFVRSTYRGDLYRIVVDIFPGVATHPHPAPSSEGIRP